MTSGQRRAGPGPGAQAPSTAAVLWVPQTGAQGRKGGRGSMRTPKSERGLHGVLALCRTSQDRCGQPCGSLPVPLPLAKGVSWAGTKPRAPVRLRGSPAAALPGRSSQRCRVAQLRQPGPCFPARFANSHLCALPTKTRPQTVFPSPHFPL